MCRLVFRLVKSGMTLHHHNGDVMSISFSPENAFFLTRLMFEVDHSAQFIQCIDCCESNNSAPRHGYQTQMRLTTPACAGEDHPGVEHHPHFLRPFLITR